MVLKRRKEKKRKIPKEESLESRWDFPVSSQGEMGAVVVQ